LSLCHFRVCITEISQPLAINRETCYLEAIYEKSKTVEGVTAESTLPSLENIYKVWRNGNIPIVVDEELSVKPLLKPDVIINAMMLNRETSTRITDAPLVIGIGPGFTAGIDVHLVIESSDGNNLGKVIVEGEAENNATRAGELADLGPDGLVKAEDTGIFTTGKNIGETVLAGDIIGNLNEVPVKAPLSGILRGLLRNEARVLVNANLAEIDPVNDKSVCYNTRSRMRSIAGGVLEAILMSLNVAEMN
jgi:xanthine dehydrogenase accessory factor